MLNGWKWMPVISYRRVASMQALTLSTMSSSR